MCCNCCHGFVVWKSCVLWNNVLWISVVTSLDFPIIADRQFTIVKHNTVIRNEDHFWAYPQKLLQTTASALCLVAPLRNNADWRKLQTCSSCRPCKKCKANGLYFSTLLTLGPEWRLLVSHAHDSCSRHSASVLQENKRWRYTTH